jgi:hypothetical protein
VETAKKSTEGESSIPAQKIILKDSGKSRFFRKTGNQGNRLDSEGNVREIAGNGTESHRIVPNASTKPKSDPT